MSVKKLQQACQISQGQKTVKKHPRVKKDMQQTQRNFCAKGFTIYLMLDSKSFHRRQNSSWSCPDDPIVEGRRVKGQGGKGHHLLKRPQT